MTRFERPPILRIIRYCCCFAISVSCSAYLLVCFEIFGVFALADRHFLFGDMRFCKLDGSLIEMSGDVCKDVECPIGSKSVSGSLYFVMSNPCRLNDVCLVLGSSVRLMV